MEPIKLSMHLYLLLTEEPILIQTGSILQAKETLPQLKELLGEKTIKYILVSHFESDECGGLSLVLEEFPQVITVCSEVTARQLIGFGITNQVEIKKPGDKFKGRDFEFDILGYPAEMHLWEGLLFVESQRKIFFSSDLMFSMGENHGQVTKKTWEDAIKLSGVDLISNIEMQRKLLDDLSKLTVNFVASGHGPCIKIIES
jgi:flavorubredoxin